VGVVYKVMKAKTLLVALFVAGLVVSVAVAAPGPKNHGKGGATTTTSTSAGTTTTSEHGKGKAKGHGKQDCRPRRAVVLRGDFVGPGAGGFAMQVKGGNKLGRSLAGKQVTVLVDDATKIRKHGKATLADLAAGDKLNVQGRACKLDAQALTLLARHVVVRGGDDEKDEDDEGSTTSSATTQSTTTDSTTTQSTSTQSTTTSSTP